MTRPTTHTAPNGSIVALIKDMMGIKNNRTLSQMSGMNLTTINHCTSARGRSQYEGMKTLQAIFLGLNVSAVFHSDRPDRMRYDSFETKDGLWVVFTHIPNYSEYCRRCARRGIDPVRLAQ